MARPKKAESIRRTSNVMVRFSSIEYELVAGYAKDAGYPISTFVRKQALSEKVTVNYNIVADIGEIQNLTAQAAGIGNNLNQIARYFHGGGLASRGMLEELKKCIAEIRELRQEIVQLGGAYRGNSKTHEEAHRKLNEQLTAIVENTMVWERALSLRNPWIQQMEQYKTPEVLDRNFVKKYIEQVVVTFLGDRQHPRCRTKSAAARTAAHAKIRAIPLTHFFKVT